MHNWTLFLNFKVHLPEHLQNMKYLGINLIKYVSGLELENTD